MTNYIPSPSERVRDQVERYERSGGTDGAEMGGRPVILVTHRGRTTGALRKTPLMRVSAGDGYVLVGSLGGAPADPLWVGNLRADPHVEIRDRAVVQPMLVREVAGDERGRLWALAVQAYPPYADYQEKTSRVIPVFIAEPQGPMTN